MNSFFVLSFTSQKLQWELHMLYNFQWFIQGKVAGSGIPSSGEDIDFLVSQGIRALVCLQEISVPVCAILKEKGIEILVFPVESDDKGDIIEPRDNEVLRIADFIKSSLAQGKPVLIHCSAGIKRTPYIFRRVEKYLR